MAYLLALLLSLPCIVNWTEWKFNRPSSLAGRMGPKSSYANLSSFVLVRGLLRSGNFLTVPLILSLAHGNDFRKQQRQNGQGRPGSPRGKFTSTIRVKVVIGVKAGTRLVTELVPVVIGVPVALTMRELNSQMVLVRIVTVAKPLGRQKLWIDLEAGPVFVTDVYEGLRSYKLFVSRVKLDR
nr:hypothetical protein HmN_000905000 [Hymenolepis microstoma]